MASKLQLALRLRLVLRSTNNNKIIIEYSIKLQKNDEFNQSLQGYTLHVSPIYVVICWLPIVLETSTLAQLFPHVLPP